MKTGAACTIRFCGEVRTRYIKETTLPIFSALFSKVVAILLIPYCDYGTYNLCLDWPDCGKLDVVLARGRVLLIYHSTLLTQYQTLDFHHFTLQDVVSLSFIHWLEEP